MSDSFHLPDSTHIRYAHLRVADLARALSFYRDLLGFRTIQQIGTTVTLSATGEPPALLILTEQADARPKPPRTTGLYHVAILLPDRTALARVIRHIAEAGWPVQGGADHGVSEALYLADPDGNGLELYRDRPRSEWRWVEGQVNMVTDPLDTSGLLALAPSGEGWTGIDPRTMIGHVHLHVSDLARAEAFYHGLLGLDVTQRSYPGALFLAAGGYHHHLGVNIWAGRGAPPPPDDAVGLVAFALDIPDDDVWHRVINRAREACLDVQEQQETDGRMSALIHDPDQNSVVILR